MRPKAQSFLRYPLSTLLGTEASVRVLRELALHGNELTTSMIAQRTGISDQSVRNVVNDLIPTGLIQIYGQGRAVSYRLDAHHPIAQALIELFLAEDRRVKEVRQQITGAAERMKPSPLAVWVFGSVARHEDGPNSDLDLCIVIDRDETTERDAEIFRELLEGVREAHQIAISVVPLSSADVERLARTRDPFWNEILRDAIPWHGRPPEDLLDLLKRRYKESPMKEAARG